MLITITVRGRQVKVHPACEAGFRADRGAGAVYGPYTIIDPITHQPRWAKDAEEASMIVGFCPYCNSY